MQGQGPANGDAVGGSTNSVSKCSACIRKPTAKLEALTVSGVLASRTKCNVVISDDEEDKGP